MINVLHVTVHLGGGVGRILSKVATHRIAHGSDVRDIIVCLEKPEKDDAISVIHESGIQVEIAPEKDKIYQMVKDADIIQLEWWHHPLMSEFMNRISPFHGRMVIWSHISGLHYPSIPLSLLQLPDFFLFTSPASCNLFSSSLLKKTKVVFSSGGFDDISFHERDSKFRRLNFGYAGTINPSKLHPDIMSFIKNVDDPDFILNMYGDSSHNPFSQKIDHSDTREMIKTHGYVQDLYSVLEDMDIFVYLLNPTHYGTTENVLLEAMAAGVVPVVLNNPVESFIVKDGKTGFIVDSPACFAQAVKTLLDHPEVRKNMSRSAAEDIRARFSLEKTITELDGTYRELVSHPKRIISMENILGLTPFEWFASGLGKYQRFFLPDNVEHLQSERRTHPFLYEKSKGSVFQYHHYFPEDPTLTYWAGILHDDVT